MFVNYGRLRHNSVLSKFISTYFLGYFFGNLSKKILMFALSAYLARTIHYSAIIMFILFYLSYMAVYLLNDYIDRPSDSTRRYISPYKLNFSRKLLLILGFFHISVFTLILFMIDKKTGILSLIIVLFGILRSYIQNQTLRETSLGILQFLQFYLFFYILGRPESLIEYLMLLLQFSIIYTFLYYIHKIPEKGESREKSIAYIIIVLIISILAFTEVKDLLTLLYIVGSLIIIFLMYRLFTRQITKKLYLDITKTGIIWYYPISFILILFVLYGYFPGIPEYTNTTKVLKLLVHINEELKETIQEFLRLF